MTFVFAVLLLSGCGRETGSSGSRISGESTASSSRSTRSEPSDWTNLYGRSFDSASPETGLKLEWGAQGPPVVWRKKMGRGYSAPVVADGKLVLVSRYEDAERIECRDASTGSLLWEFDYPTTYSCDYEYSNGPYATPVIFDERVLVVGAQGQFHCLALASGQLIWERNLLQDYEVSLKEWPVTTSPLFVEGRIVFNLGAVEVDAGIVGLDPQTGETVWEATNHEFSHASPVAARIHGQPLVFTMTDAGLVCLEPETGKVFWEVPHRLRQGDRYNAVSPVVHGDRVCIVTGPSVKPGFRCFQIGPGAERSEPWKDIRLLNSQYTNLVVQDDLLLGFTPVKQGGPELIAIDLRTGKKAWKAKPELGRGNMLWVDGRLLILGEDGVLAGFTADRGGLVELWRTSQPLIEKPCYTSMALSGGRLYARNEKEIVCLDLRPGAVSGPAAGDVAVRQR